MSCRKPVSIHSFPNAYVNIYFVNKSSRTEAHFSERLINCLKFNHCGVGEMSIHELQFILNCL